MMKTWLVAASVLAVFVVSCSPKLEEGEILEKKGDTFTIRLEKKVDEPIDKVWEAFQRPEDIEKYSEQYQQSKLVKSEGDTKVVDYRVSALGQVNAFTMELKANPAEKRIDLKTLESALVDITGSYEIKPAPDGKGTLVVYKATQKDKANIPVPVSVQKTAIKDSFDNLIAGMKKGIQAQGGAS
ncbi:MAG: SRPBCC family protein [Deltaproteobacteria bacterium]|nr:SRPBCC family protein [Deltaproteobacteria bacterium]